MSCPGSPNRIFKSGINYLEWKMDNAYYELLEQTKKYCIDYLDGIQTRNVFPDEKALAQLETCAEPLPTDGAPAAKVIEHLRQLGEIGTTSQIGGRYFGFVTGGILPVAHAAEWLVDTWNQNAALYVMSPLSSRLESICEKWLAELFNLPPDTAMGLATGSANALICALAAARNELLARQGYDLQKNGLRNAPPFRVVLGEDAHACVWSALSVLGIGRQETEIVPTDEWGRLRLDRLPPLDAHTLLILQAGNVCGGHYDPIDECCDRAKKAGAWAHIDGAFGLWAAVSSKCRHFVKGFEKADSWSMDAHKTLNAGYDCGIVLCRNRAALANALSASGAYIQYGDQRDNMLYTTEMSRRARAVALWAVIKCLGANGIEEMIDKLCANAEIFSRKLAEIGFILPAPVCFNQFMIKLETPERTKKVLSDIQKSGVIWCGAGLWKGEPVIRVSVSSHATDEADIARSAAVFADALKRI